MQSWEVRDAKSLIKFVETHQPTYKKNGNHFQYGQMDNGAFVSSLLNFLDDNPGAIEGIVEFMDKNKMIPSEDEEDLEED